MHYSPEFKSTGDIIITTEIDLSWGSNVIVDILKKFKSEPNAEVVIASPNLKEGIKMFLFVEYIKTW